MTTARPLLKASVLAPVCENAKGALPSLSCEIHPNTITCIIGDTAAIATRYMRTLGGIDRPATGAIHLLGVDLSRLGRKEWLAARKNIGYVGRGAPLLSVMGGLRNVMLPALYHKLGSLESVEAHARSLIAALQCDADLASLPAYLTDVQRRQLAIARALVLDPKLFLLDAPFDGLDMASREKISSYLAKWPWFAGRALLLATEDLYFVREHADNILFVSERGAHVFRAWPEFMDSPADEVRHFIQECKKQRTVFD